LELILVKSAVAIGPVLSMLGAFAWLDAFKLVSWRRLAGLLAAGGLVAVLTSRYTMDWFCLEVPTALVRDDDRTHRFGEVDVRQS
jgi:hypothetical protein